MRAIAFLSIGQCLFSVAAASSAHPTEASLELMIGDPPPCFSLLRKGSNIPVKPRMALENGDVFTVTRTDCQAALRLGDKIRDPVVSTDTPLTIEVAGQPSPAWAALDALMEKLLTGFMRSDGVYPKRRSGLLGPMSWPLKDQAFAPPVVLTNQRLSLAWAGGVAPFQIKVVDPDGGTACNQAGVWERRVVCDLATVRTGSYRVELKDSDSHPQVKTGYLAVVDSVPADCLDRGVLPRKAEKPVEAVDLAISLATCAGPMQALQVVVPSSPVFPPARWLERYLVGDQP